MAATIECKIWVGRAFSKVKKGEEEEKEEDEDEEGGVRLLRKMFFRYDKWMRIIR